MKKLLSTIFAVMATVSVFSQSATFTATMQKYVTQLDTASVPATIQDLANKFERVGNAEPTEWLPEYYAALCYYTTAFMQKDPKQIDAIVDKGDAFLDKAIKISPNESEIYVLKGMSAGARIMVDPMTRARQYGPLSTSYYDKAMALNKENPRVYLLKGEAIAYTPEQYGGGAAKAEPLISTSLDKYKNDVAATSIFPHWGKDQAQKLSEWIAQQKAGEAAPADKTSK